MPALTQWPALAVMLLILGAATPAIADAASDAADCNQADDPDRRIRGCSNLIQSDNLAGAALADAYGKRGDAFAETHDHSRAVADYDEAIRLGADRAGGSEGDRRGAARDLADAYYKRGSFYVWRQGDFDRGIADLDKALELDPDHVMAYRTRGWAHQRNGDYDRANADYDAAIRRYVDDCPAGLKSFHPS